ncbi:MAG: ribonuclease Z [Gemmatimonadaceae bacterium]|nr:ribonuclease Z [Gemmatimonadaceae bacterium]
MRLTTIGTGTAAPHPSRVSAAHLVEAGNVRLLLDCGSGAVHRMAQLGIAWQDITHVALTHFHADHISDFPLLVMGWKWGQLPPRSTPVTVYGPPGLGALLERMAAVYGEWLLAPGFPLTVREIQADEVVRLPDDVTLQSFPVPHTAESVAYCIGEGSRRLVYTGDTGVSEALGDWAGDCDVLLAECSLPDSMAIASHLTPRQVGELAARARARQLVLTHFYAPVELVDIREEAGVAYSGPIVLAADGWHSNI